MNSLFIRLQPEQPLASLEGRALHNSMLQESDVFTVGFGINFLMALVCLSVLMVSSLSVVAQTGRYVPELARYDARMTTILGKYAVAGGQLAITYRGRLVYSRGFGYADTVSKELVQPTSIFRLASVSKAITSVGLMHLVETGQLSLDALVFGPQGLLDTAIYRNATDTRMHDITIRQLMSHSAGYEFVFPSDPIFQTYAIAIENGETPPTTSPERLIQWALKSVTLKYSPGTSASYTNFAYVILGKVIEQVTGVGYESYIRDSILAPMNITDIRAGKTLPKDRLPKEVSYYDYAGAPLSTSIYTGIPNSVPAQYGGYNWEVMTPAGGWVASAQDLCRLLVSVDGFETKPDFLAQASIYTMSTPSRYWPAYGLGWNVGGNDYWHTGGIQGTASVVHCNAEHELNWAISFNALPKNYGPLYTEFMSMVLNEFPNITSWPTHDLWDESTGISEDGTLVKVFPNPATDNVTISVGVPINRLDIFNHLGEIAYSGSFAASTNSVELNLSLFPSGLYSVHLNRNQPASQVKSNKSTFSLIVSR